MNDIRDLFPGRMRERTFQLKAKRDAGAVWHEPQFVECKQCGRRAARTLWAKSLYVCPNCGYHMPIGGYYRLSLVLDHGSFRELDADLAPQDVLDFPGYGEKLSAAQNKTGLREAAVTAAGRIGGVACVAAVLMNLTAGKLPSQYLKYDVSDQKLFTTGDQTAEIVKGLDEDITLYLIAQQGSEDATLQELLDRYAGLSSHIKVETKDPVLYPNFVSQYTSENLSENSVLVVGQNRSKAVDYYDIYQYSMDYSTYSSSLSSFDGEGQITSAIAYVTAEDMPVVYTLTGHDEAELSTTVTSSIEKENIELKSLSLLTEEAVPEDAKAVIIYGAISDISEDEKNKLEAYMEQGGQMVLLLGYTDKDTPNLDSLLGDYGITLADGLVLEGDSQHHLPNYPYYLLPDIQSSAYTSDVSSRYVLLAFAQGMTEAADISEDLTYESLLTTSAKSYSKTNLESENLDQEEGDIVGPFDLGAVVTKTIDEDTEAKLIVFSSETLLDEQVDSMVSGGNSTLFLNVMSQLVDHESTVSIEPKSMSTEYLTVPAGSAIFWGILTIILIPLLLLATGGIIWFGRRKR